MAAPADSEARRVARGRPSAVEPPCRDQAARHHAQRAEGQAGHNEGRVPAHRLGRWKPSCAPGERVGTESRGYRLLRESEKKHTSLYRIGSTSTVLLTSAWSSASKYHTKLANINVDNFFDLTALYLVYILLLLNNPHTRYTSVVYSFLLHPVTNPKAWTFLYYGLIVSY